MQKSSVEAAVGVFVLIGLACVGYLTIQLGRMELLGTDYYVLSARFQNISGLKIGSRVEMAGVNIGKVDEIDLDPERLVAVVHMKIKKGIELADDSIASIKTSGLIGDKFIKLTPGVSDDFLQQGGVITETESALDIEELIGNFAFGNIK
jgi:phospholipid/cholesterol/gamma-HCH transport system substrate-binding protein